MTAELLGGQERRRSPEEILQEHDALKDPAERLAFVRGLSRADVALTLTLLHLGGDNDGFAIHMLDGGEDEESAPQVPHQLSRTDIDSVSDLY